MAEANLPRPVNLYYPRPSRAHTLKAGEVGCERYSDPAKARKRAQELIQCGAVLGPVRIEDVETGALIEQVMRPQ